MPDRASGALLRTQQCETDTRALPALACERACGPDADPAWAAFTAPQVAQRIRGERRATALRRLLGSHEAYEACLPGRPRMRRDATPPSSFFAGVWANCTLSAGSWPGRVRA
ncbi:hypothetical protein [Streptomyces sp. NBC_00151]|uniref:hypothetical protein n=1 Tax=Streptomyces sp. NBC_00151 TaxID=2975669 RepID=UPI002DDB5E85|nr:hypothetical protein [Streptomyces sp. NBC_00151]WRZ36991.1 hypothetical protein OG915_02270 [Streptomyces sp. NBC_00151]